MAPAAARGCCAPVGRGPASSPCAEIHASTSSWSPRWRRRPKGARRTRRRRAPSAGGGAAPARPSGARRRPTSRRGPTHGCPSGDGAGPVAARDRRASPVDRPGASPGTACVLHVWRYRASSNAIGRRSYCGRRGWSGVQRRGVGAAERPIPVAVRRVRQDRRHGEVVSEAAGGPRTQAVRPAREGQDEEGPQGARELPDARQGPRHQRRSPGQEEPQGGQPVDQGLQAHPPQGAQDARGARSPTRSRRW